MFPARFSHFAVLLAFVAGLLALAVPAHAEQIPDAPRYGSEKMAVDLFAQGPWTAGETMWVALRFTPSTDEWHGYWSNPGDAGKGMRLVMPVPQGWDVGEPVYPVPERLLIGSLMNHIYKGSYTVLVPVKVGPEGATAERPALAAYVEYLACTDRICVPQDAIVRARSGGDFARWRAEIAPLLDSPARFAFSGQQLRIAVPLPASVALPDPHIFVRNERLVDYAAGQRFYREGDALVAEIALDPRGSGEAQEVSGILRFGDGAGVRFEAEPGAVPAGGRLIAGPVGTDTPPLWALVLGALLGGLLLNIMPCVFPILSLKALSLARAGESEAKARAEGLAYTAGTVIACTALGALLLAFRAAGEQVGWAFQLQNPAVVIALLVIASVITINLAGLFELPGLPIRRGGSESGAFATGLLAAFVATPCTGPFMAAALGAALLLPAAQALVLFAVLGLGLALPFLALGFVPALRRRLPRPGPWMERFRRVMAIPMGLTALALIWLTAQLGGKGFALFALVVLLGIAIALGVVGRLQRAGKLAWPAFGLVAAPFVIFGAFALPSSYDPQASETPQSLHEPQSFSRAALETARASGQPVFLWFTADWCVTCKVNESVAIERSEVVQAFDEAGVVTMVGDWTRADPEIAGFLADQGVAGVPLYLWYPAGGGAPRQLPQVITPGLLVDLARPGPNGTNAAARRVPASD